MVKDLEDLIKRPHIIRSGENQCNYLAGPLAAGRMWMPVVKWRTSEEHAQTPESCKKHVAHFFRTLLENEIDAHRFMFACAKYCETQIGIRNRVRATATASFPRLLRV